MRARFWTAERLAKADEMKRAGQSYREIGQAFGGKTEGAVSDAINRYRNKPSNPTSYWDGPAIGITQEDRRLREDAIIGSAMLREQIERVFGRAA